MSKRKTLLIGWDAADWKMITPLIDEGKMPNIKKFLENGALGNLSTLQPVLSPMLWSSIATGKRPYKHGIYGFSEPDPISGGIRPVTNLSRKTKAIWNILNQEEKNTITVGWWPSNPAEELSRGVMVSNDYQRAQGATGNNWPMKPGTVHPKRLESVLKDLRFHPSELTEEDLRPFLPGIDGMSREELDQVEQDPRVKSLMKIIADCTSIHSAATALIQNEPWDLMCVYYDAIDHFGHAFMKYHPPQRKKVSDWDFKVFSYCMEAGYLYHDMMLGSLMDLVDEDTTVILMSDHGFHPDDQRLSMIPREPAGPAAEHRQFGIFAITGPDIQKGGKVYGASLIDICPTLLHLHGLPLGEDMDGKPLTSIYASPQADQPTIPSWDDVQGDHGMHPPDKQISPEDSKAALEQLVALGYIDEPDADQSKALEQTVRELDYNLAQAYIDGGIYNHAVAILERLYTRWPMEHRFGFKLTACYKNQNNNEKLRSLVDTLIHRRIQEAEDAVKEINALNLDNEDVQKSEQLRIDAMSEDEQQEFSRQRNELLVKSRPNIFTLRYLEAYTDFSEGLFSEALEKLDQLDSDLGARRMALCLRGDIYSRLKQWTEARAAYSEALDYDREYPEALQGLARVALAERQFTEAATFATESLNLLYFQPRAHYILGLAYYRAGKVDRAERAFATCVSQAPLFSKAYHKLADISRRYRHDPHAYTFFRKKVTESREKLKELRGKKWADVEAFPRSVVDDEIRDMPELGLHPEALSDVDSSEVITIVSGLPRSGTSLMMQMIEAAGIKAHTDGNRAADESNSKGYYEHDSVAGLLTADDSRWITLAEGECIKIVAPLLSTLPVKIKVPDSEPKTLHYRVIFMERNMEEILHSQATMLKKLGKSPEKNEKQVDISKAFMQQARHAKQRCNTHGIPALSVSYNELVHHPDSILSDLATFLNQPEALTQMKLVIDPKMHRSVLTVGRV